MTSRWWRWAGGAGGVAALLWFAWPAAGQGEAPGPAAPAIAVPAAAPTTPAAVAPVLPAAPVAAIAPFSPAGLATRDQQRALAQARLERAQLTLDTYLQAARYPHDSRPADEHADQLRPFDPIAEDRALVMAGGGTPVRGVRLKTTQERVFLAGAETARITLSLVDEQGRTLPLRVTRSALHEVAQPGRNTGTAVVGLPFTDDGTRGDTQAGDGVWSAVVAPAQQGFGSVAGLLRLDVALEYGGQPGEIYFDLVYSPEQAARWLPGVKEAKVDGSLVFTLTLDVKIAGRYVVSARVDDANGLPFVVALFNEELAAGPRAVPLRVFGKLVHDRQPAFPLTVRDVDGFLLKPDAYPDRVMLERRAGVQHVSQPYAAADFSDATWASEDRTRYLRELGGDVADARRELDRLGP